jgi:hypothetical protein
MQPITYLVLEFPGSKLKGEIIPALADLVEQGTIRILDLLVVRKGLDSTLEAVEISSLPDEESGALAQLVPPTVGLFNERDIALLSEVLEPGSTAGFLLFEHLWAKNFTDAIANAEGRWVLMQSVPQDVVNEALAALPA